MLIARIEALIAGASVDEALSRAEAYVAAGVDAIMIHSKASSPDEVLEFARRFPDIAAASGRAVPLVCVPTTYSQATGEFLSASGFDIVIYANHLLRSSMRAMRDTCATILTDDRTTAVDNQIASVHDIFEITDYFRAQELDQ